MTSPPGPTAPQVAVIDGVNVDDVVAAVLGCAGVAGLDGGRFGEVTSYLPGRQVPGVIVRDESVLVQVRARWGVSAADLFRQIIAAVAPLAGRRWVEVVLGDIDDSPGGQPGAAFGVPQYGDVGARQSWGA